MTPARDEAATTVYLREPPLPARPPLLAPEPARAPPLSCTTCPFRQAEDRPITLVLPEPLRPDLRPVLPLPANDRRPTPARPAARLPTPTLLADRQPVPATATLTELRPVAAPRVPTGTTTEIRPAAGATTVIQPVAPRAPQRRPGPLPAHLARLQLALWLVIAAGLLFLAFRPGLP